MTSINLLDAGLPQTKFVKKKKAVFAHRNKAKHNKTRYAYIQIILHEMRNETKMATIVPPFTIILVPASVISQEKKQDYKGRKNPHFY